MSTTAKTNTLSNIDTLQWPTEERIRWVEQAICHSPTINGWDIAGYAAFNIKPINTATLAKSFVLGPVEFPKGAAFNAEDEHKQLYHHPKDWLTNLKALPVDHARSYMRTSLLICNSYAWQYTQLWQK